MEYNEQKQERVILAGVHRGMRDALWDTTEESIHELGELVKTAGGIVVGEMIQNKADLESATYMGEGKLDELKIAIETLNADMVVFDDELSPVQMRNICLYLIFSQCVQKAARVNFKLNLHSLNTACRDFAVSVWK